MSWKNSCIFIIAYGLGFIHTVYSNTHEVCSASHEISTMVDFGNNWIKSQEADVLKQLKNSENSTYCQLSAYTTAFWIGNKTNVRNVFELDNNQTASANIHILENSGNLAMVLMYNEIDNIDTGLEDGVPFDDTMSHSGFNLNKTFLISGVMSVSIFEENATISAQVEYILPIVQEKNESSEYEKYVCGFYDTVKSKWSTVGCFVLNFTQNAVSCFCSHLTSFTVLMQISDYELPYQDQVINSWITTIGLTLSVVTLAINLLIYLLLRAYKISLRHKIHINFILCILFVNILFLTSINSNGSKLLCKLVAGLLHYLVLCMFMWMLAEAIFLVIKVLKNAGNRFKLKHYMMLCYLPPICIVATVATINHDCYLSETLCWLRNECRWAVVIPSSIITEVNIIVLGKMVYVIYKRSGPMLKKRPKIQKEYKQLRNAVRGSFVLFPILGVTWIFGTFTIVKTNIILTYIYNILNSLQGVFVFVVFCFLDNEITESGKKLIAKYMYKPTIKKNRITVLPVSQCRQRRRNTSTSPNEASLSTATTNI